MPLIYSDTTTKKLTDWDLIRRNLIKEINSLKSENKSLRESIKIKEIANLRNG